jgi:hypothetical protein
MSETPQLPTRPPRRNLETAAFWEGCAEHRLMLPRCDDCGQLIWYPRRYCPFCASRNVTDVAVSGRGTVYSFTVMRRGAGPFRSVAPYVVAYVELDEGPRVMTNVVGTDPERLAVGDVVEVVFEPIVVDGAPVADTIPRFRPVG